MKEEGRVRERKRGEDLHTFPHSGGTCALLIQLNTSSRSADITTKPFIPFSKSIRDSFIILSNAL